MGFRGVFTALVTPFKNVPQKPIDEKEFRALIEIQIKSGTQGIVIAGSTGEGSVLTRTEWLALGKIASEYRSSIQIILNCSSSSTEESLDRMKAAEEMNAHGCLISSPPYNKPPQRGIFAHFEYLAKNSKLPIMVYNIVGRTAVNILPETMKELWKLPNIVSLKESSGQLDQALSILQDIPNGKTLLSGDDSWTWPLLQSGALGIVSVASNISPAGMQSLWNHSQSQNNSEGLKLHRELMKLFSILFVESNPIPLKFLTGELRESSSYSLRLPLVSLDSKFHADWKKHIRQIGKSIPLISKDLPS